MIDPAAFPDGLAPITLAEFRDRILELYKPPMRSANTWYSMRRSLDLLMQLDGMATTADLTSSAVARFVTSRTGLENPNTTRTHLRKLSAAFSIAVGEGWIARNPCKIRKSWVRPVAPKQPRVISRAEMRDILDLARREIQDAHPAQRWKARRLYALVATLAYTGVRKNEAIGLRIEDVRLADRMIFLTSRADRQFKTDAAAQPVPIPEALAPILKGWMAQLDRAGCLFPNATLESPWTGGPQGKRAIDAVRALAERAGVPGVTIQGFRHSYATHAEFFGLTEVQIQRILRHTTPKTQLHYRHAELTNLRAMVARVDFGDGPRPAAPVPSAAAIPDTEAAAPPPAVPEGTREVPGWPAYRVGADWSLWTNHRRDGHAPRPGSAATAWRKLDPYTPKGAGAPVANLSQGGQRRQRTLPAILRDAFGYVPPRPAD